jgi:hypothetical protein
VLVRLSLLEFEQSDFETEKAREIETLGPARQGYREKAIARDLPANEAENDHNEVNPTIAESTSRT